jgi:hypothetical protein
MFDILKYNINYSYFFKIFKVIYLEIWIYICEILLWNLNKIKKDLNFKNNSKII